MQYAYTIFYVRDVAKTVSFYQKAFGFSLRFITPEQDYAELLSGETTISFAATSLAATNFKKQITLGSSKTPPFGVTMAFTTTTIVADFKKALACGAVLFRDIQEKPWGQKVGYLQDNNGFLIEICTPIKNR